MSFFRAVLLGAALALTGAGDCVLADTRRSAELAPPARRSERAERRHHDGAHRRRGFDRRSRAGGRLRIQAEPDSRTQPLRPRSLHQGARRHTARRLDRGARTCGAGPQRGGTKADRMALSARQEQRRYVQRDRRLPQSQSRLARPRHALCARRKSHARHDGAERGAVLVRQSRSANRYRQECGWAKR